ncbi:MAG TPA: xanthine dehydrogenase family protein molybdopterin-binding subunit [Stellaceae bacterium]|jgi:carbon-monoxide dehydrogenase large subunit|nr:xanthine dehydrogenase family protein molybdopterin-binding subunit [Stellaceae bacterium]
MDGDVSLDQLAFSKFAVGQPVPRNEDPMLLRGRGRYTDDLKRPGQAYAVMLRSGYAHGVINGIDIAEALAMPGVLGIYTGPDLTAAGIKNMPLGAAVPTADGSPMHRPSCPVLTSDKVRYVGDPIAIVVAESVAQAKDAAEAVFVDIEPLPAATRASEAAAPGAPQLHDGVPGNVAASFHYGDAEKVAAAFAAAAHVTRLEIPSNRIVVCPMEPRAAIAEYDAAANHWTLQVGCQGVFGLKGGIANILGVEKDKVRVLTGNVGGSFGMKSAVYPEYIALFHAARVLGRPVKWTDERSESFVSDSHGRDHEMTAELALDADSHFLAVRITGYGNMGAYVGRGTPVPASANAVKNTIGVYRTPLLEVATKLVITNTQPVGAYRGAGRPEGNYYMERLVDTAAAEMGIDRIELRRRNHIPEAAMPHKAPNGTTYDSGEFTAVLNEAVARSDWDGYAARKEDSRRRGLLRGRGIGDYLEVTGPPQQEMGGIRFEPNGDVTIITGTLDYGQGHWTPFAQVLHQTLGIPFERIRLLQGDSDELIAGGGTGGSKSLMASGTAILEAAEKVIEKGRQVAAQVLEAAPDDIEFDRGRFVIGGTDRFIGIMELAETLRGGIAMPEDMPDSLDVQHIMESTPSAFPNGCHVAEVEIDPETGVVAVVKYSMVNDFGVIVNPLLVEGQAHGGVVQGIGQALMERTVYDSDGQFLTGSFMDYALPRATDAVSFQIASHPVPAKTNPLGAKGCGEAGCAGSLPAVMNAVVDALSEYGIRNIDMPATPFKVWQAIRQARAGLNASPLVGRVSEA